jgi:mannose-1-phosphate guanylyltransferase
VRDGKVTLVVDKNRTQDIEKVVKSLYKDEKFKNLL